MAGSGSGFFLEEDIKEYNCEKDVKTTVKTEEELRLLTVDESLNEIQRANHIITCGQEVQCISVVRNLPFLYKNWESESLQKVIPKLIRVLKNAGIDLQLVTAEVLKTIAEEGSIPASVYEQNFLSLITSCLDNKDSVVAETWISCLVSAIAYLPKESVQNNLLKVVLLRGKLSKPITSRLSCCTLLGAISEKLGSEKIIIKEIVPAMKQLCQDIDFTVRACMCKHLSTIAQVLGRENTKLIILPEILELAGDEEVQVRSAALMCLMQIKKLLNADVIKDNVVPLVCQYCENGVHKQDASLIDIAENFGKFCHTFADYYSKERKLALLRIFRLMCKEGRLKTERLSTVHLNSLRKSATSMLSMGSISIINPESREKLIICRRRCAYNFPAMTLFCGRELFQKELLGALSVLSCDTDVQVRKHVAAGLHEIGLQLEEDAAVLLPHLLQLLDERDSPQILEAIIETLPVLLKTIVVKGRLGENKAGSVNELCNALLSAELKLETKWPCAWRAVASFAEHIATFPDFFTTEPIRHKIFPLTFKFLTVNQYLPVRNAAASSVCILILRTRRHDHRLEMCDRLIQDLCHSSCYRNRILFFTVCSNMMKHFSSAFFKEHFFGHVLQLIKDPVANVRIRLWKMLPALKKLLVLPRDRLLHGHLEENVRKMLATETDKDVNEVIQASIMEMDQTKVFMETITGQPLPVDTNDQKKEEDERLVQEENEKVDDQSLKPSRKTLDSKRNHRSISALSPSFKASEKTSSVRHVSDQGLSDGQNQLKPFDSKSKSSATKPFSSRSSNTSNDTSYLPSDSFDKGRKSPKRISTSTAESTKPANAASKVTRKSPNE